MESRLRIFDSEEKCKSVLSTHKKVLVSISGGSDSDIMLDLIERCRKGLECEIHYVFFDTGIESKATKEHLIYLEQHYGITIERERAKVPVPLGCIDYGQPFFSKYVSDMIGRLQEKNFDFKLDGGYDELMKKYKRIQAPIKWWCNWYPSKKGKISKFNIEIVKGLKEFMIKNPPTFKISNKCCLGAKKIPAHDYIKKHNIDLDCVGLRQAEGGIRTFSIDNCFDNNIAKNKKTYDVYRPVWWYTDKDKEFYEKQYGVVHSKLYTDYGFKRTGCMGCPFNSKFSEDLEKIKDNEPQLYKAVCNIFKDSYDYTMRYREFKKAKKQGFIQYSLFEKGETK